MDRRQFLNTFTLLSSGIYLNPLSMTSMIEPWPIRTYTSPAGLRIHAFSTGSVRVKKAHRNPNPIGFGAIMLDPRWTEALPVHCWLIEHPEGLILIDTGENQRFHEKGYLDCDPSSGWVNQKILRFEISRAQEVDRQLGLLGFCPDDIRWIVLTHLHIDHVDGLHHFPQAEILLSRTEYQRPFGAVLCHLPKWFQPRLIQPTQSHSHFAGAYTLTEAEDVLIVPTPGHSHGHQSVILKTPELDFCFAGDLSFSEAQLREDKVAGICVDKKAARNTYAQVKAYAQQHQLVYLPSHDPGSGERLVKGEVFQ